MINTGYINIYNIYVHILTYVDYLLIELIWIIEDIT